MSSDDLPQRSYPAQHPWRRVDNRAVIVFLTVCTKDRRPILAAKAVHALLLESWEKADAWSVGRYVMMPDNVHLFAAPQGIDTPSVRTWMSYWKSLVSRNWTGKKAGPIWQRDAWDRQLRSGDSYAAKWDYVRTNPVRHGLVEKADDWPFQGEVEELPWHD